MSEKRDPSDRQQKWMVVSFSNFTAKLELVFVLTFENAFSTPFERSACFYVTISGSFKRFQYVNFEKHFLENKNFFQKTGVPFFSWNH